MVANNEDVAMSDLKFDIYIKTWTKREVEFQVDFENPLAISQNKKRDDFIIKIIDKSLFISEDGLMELPDEESVIIISFPR